MPKVTVTCPRCLVQYNIDEAHLGKTGHCKKCDTTFVLTCLVDTSTKTQLFPASALSHAATTGHQVIYTGDTPEIWNVGDVILDAYEVKPLKAGFDTSKHYAEGGMGLVYRVRHRGWDLDLALKRPKRETFQTERGKENFERECTTWVELGLHPNIVSCYYVRRIGDIPMVFAEFVEEGSLDDWIENRMLYQGGPEESLRRILDIAIQFAWGLEYAHENRLIHQDVKPDNVMMDGGVPKVTDFGLAKARVAAGEYVPDATQRSMFVSWGGMTPAFCSPEQIEAALQVKSGVGDQERTHLTRRTDIWSFGVSLLSMFMGTAPCTAGGHTAGKVLKKYLGDPPQSDILPPLPPSVADLLTGCFRTNPADRPQSMTEMVEVLQRIYLNELGSSYPRQKPVTTQLKADSLNNRAASLLDLGKVEEASKCLEEAWELHPWQPQVAQNRGLLLWRTGQITDRDLILHLQELCRTRPLDWEAAYSMGLVQLERGELKQALKSLEQAIGLGGRFEVQATLDEARTLIALAPRCVRTFTELPRNALRVYLSSDSRWVLAQIDEQSLCLCNALTGQLAVTFHTTGTELSAGAVSSDGRWKLTGEDERNVQLWDLTKNRKVRTFRTITWGAARRAVGGDGSLELSATDDFSIVLKDRESGNLLQAFWGHTDKINTVCLSADGEWVVSGGNDRTLRIWEVASGRCLRTFKAHAGAVRAVYLASDGRWALSTGLDRTLKLWNLELLRDKTRRFVSPTALCHITSSEEAGRAQADFVDLCEQARRAAGVGDYDEALERIREARGLPGYEVGREALDLWAMAGRHCRRKYFLDAWPVQSFDGHSKDIHAGVLSVDGRIVVSASWDNTVRVWEADTGQCLWNLEGHSDSVRSVSLDADGTRALSASWDKTLRLWDIENGTCLRVFEGHGNCVTSAHMSPDGRRALSGSWDQRLRLWDLEAGTCIQSYSGHQSHINSVFLSSHGIWALSGSEDKSARLWDLNSGECLRVFEGHADWVMSVVLSADNRLALTGAKDWTLRLWEVASGKCIRILKGHEAPVTSVCLSSDGRWALSGSKDRTVRLWELEGGSCVHVFKGHSGGVSSVFLSRDCRWMLSGSEDWSLRLWELDWEYDFPGWKDWDEAARPHLETFLTLQTPVGNNKDSVVAPLEWDQVEFHSLMRVLQDHGLGYLKAQGIRDELERMAVGWDGPPRLRETGGRGKLGPRSSS